MQNMKKSQIFLHMWKVFKLFHSKLIHSDSKYIKSFLGVKHFVEEILEHRVWDVWLSIHANESRSKVFDEKNLNVPAVNEVTILMPENYNVITKDCNR